MNYYDARLIRNRAIAGEPVNAETLAEANKYMSSANHAPVVVRARVILDTHIPYDRLCSCGARYGMHRVGDFGCPNPKWTCGNGQPQWSAAKWMEQ